MIINILLFSLGLNISLTVVILALIKINKQIKETQTK